MSASTILEEETNEPESTATHVAVESPRTHPAWHQAVAGGVAGFGSRMITAPLDLIRIRRQLTPRTLYPSESIWQSWKLIVEREGGVTALYRGNLAAIYLWMGYSAVQFSLYKQTKDALSDSSLHPMAIAFVAGATAGTAATLSTYPFDVCRTTFAARGVETALPVVAQQQTVRVPLHSLMDPQLECRFPTPKPKPQPPPQSFLEFAVHMYRQQGWKGFFAGAGPAVLQIIPYMGLNFCIYDFLTQESHRSVLLSAWAGSISGATSKLLVYPMDTIKRRIQAQAFYCSSTDTAAYKSTWDCLRRIWVEEGWTSFYRGVVPSVLKSTIASGLTFSLYRTTTNLLEHLHDGYYFTSFSTT